MTVVCAYACACVMNYTIFTAVTTSNYEMDVALRYRYGSIASDCSENFTTMLTSELPRLTSSISTACDIPWHVEITEAEPGSGYSVFVS